MMAPAPLLGVLAVAIVLLLRQNRYAPASLVLMVLGVGIVAWQGKLPAAEDLTVTLPPLTLPRLSDIWQAMLLAGFAQIPLSITALARPTPSSLPRHSSASTFQRRRSASASSCSTWE